MISNPYEAPRTHDDPPPPAVREERVLASPALRLGGALIDSALMYALMLPGALRVMDTAQIERDLYQDYVIPIAGPALVLVVVQALLISTRGQSVGKLIVGTRIVRTDGAPAGFLHGVLIRQWLAYLPWGIPGVGSLIAIVDSLMVFRRSRRCGHDMFAGTIVVKAVSTDVLR
jgi:uncharacterized RDD family membrane protein YckC